MARKTIRVNLPSNIDDLVVLFEKIIVRNDGVLPAVPQTTIYVTLGALLSASRVFEWLRAWPLFAFLTPSPSDQAETPRSRETSPWLRPLSPRATAFSLNSRS